VVTDHQKYRNCVVVKKSEAYTTKPCGWYGFQHLGILWEMCSGSNTSELLCFCCCCLFLLLFLAFCFDANGDMIFCMI